MNARTTALSALIAMRRQDAWADGALKDYTARDRLDRPRRGRWLQGCYTAWCRTGCCWIFILRRP